jgi:YD repeat-containing protein
MAPVRFTGTVVVTYPGETGVDRYEYRDGRLVRYRDHTGADDRYTWDDRDRLLEETACSPADGLLARPASCDHFTSEYEGDRLVRTTGAGLDLRYDELARLVAGSYRGMADEVTWSTCP